MSELDSFRQNGFANLGALLSSSQLAELLSFVSTQMPDEDFSSIGGSELIERFPFLLFDVVLNDAVIGFMNEVLGEGARLNSCSMIKTQGQSHLDWHRDIFGAVPVGEGYQRPTAVNLLIYLQDLNEELGAFILISRSHRDRVTLTRAQKALPHGSQVPIYCNGGDSLVIHNYLLHSRGINKARNLRANLSFVFSACYVKPNIDLSHSWITSVRETFLARGLQKEAEMLGDVTRYRELINCGFIE